ncbi:MAG TPA: hypothetical protein VGV40_10465 [Solirubrobacteraceae bacterium]|nr:hypothetical protein [Solirubrobacteraceae bacterium]
MSDAVRKIADAVLYEGYLLWPYRRSAMKNQQRFTFGGVYPQGWPQDRCAMQTQCLVEADPARSEAPDVDVRARFLHMVDRRLHDAQGRPVDQLVAGGERYLSWEEAVEREVSPGPMTIAAGRHEEALEGGRIVRTWQALEGRLEVGRERLRPGLWRLSVRLENTAAWAGEDRPATLRRSLCSSHAVLRARGGAFVSLTDPPEELRAEAQACVHDGVWPILVGEEGRRDTLLASPIILEDHPKIAPESPGDLFDGGEIDQMLVLNILSLTDEEKREMAGSDPKARAILERTEALSPQELMRLNGAIRDFQVVR